MGLVGFCIFIFMFKSHAYTGFHILSEGLLNSRCFGTVTMEEVKKYE